MSYAVEILVTVSRNLRQLSDTAARRLPFLHDTIEAAQTAGAEFLKKNGHYIASKEKEASIALFQIVDDGGEIVVAPTQLSNPCECGPDGKL